MKKTLFYSTLVLLFVSSLSASVALAHGGGKFSGKSGQDITETFFQKAHLLMASQDKLELSDDQVNTIRNLKMEVKKSLIRQEAELQVAKLDIASQLYSEKPDAKELQKLIDQKYEAKKNMEKTVVDAYFKVKGTLNDKQIAALKEMKKEGGCPICGGGRGGHSGHGMEKKY